MPALQVSAPDPDPSVSRVLALLRREAETDREVMEAGTRAFVSYVRGYKEHHCKYIFRIQVGTCLGSRWEHEGRGLL